MKDLSNADTVDQREQIIKENQAISTYINKYKLPLVHIFDFCGKPGYIRLLNQIAPNNSSILVLGPNLDITIDSILNQLSTKEKQLIRL